MKNSDDRTNIVVTTVDWRQRLVVILCCVCAIIVSLFVVYAIMAYIVYVN